MAMELILATSNPGKIREIRALAPEWILKTARELGFTEAIPEPYDRFDLNAEAKAKALFDFSGKLVLAEDSGLSVNALQGAPGVQSARFAGPEASDEDNRRKLLAAMEGQKDRSAAYTSVFCLITPQGASHFFEGRCEGHILEAEEGTGGFGYDPLFVPRGYKHSFGVLPASVKQEISHRAQALKGLSQWLAIKGKELSP